MGQSLYNNGFSDGFTSGQLYADVQSVGDYRLYVLTVYNNGEYFESSSETITIELTNEYVSQLASFNVTSIDTIDSNTVQITGYFSSMVELDLNSSMYEISSSPYNAYNNGTPYDYYNATYCSSNENMNIRRRTAYI